MRTLIAALTTALLSCYPLRNARIIDGTENEDTAWICVPEQDEPLNTGGIMCGRIDHVLIQGDAPVIRPLDAGIADL